MSSSIAWGVSFRRKTTVDSPCPRTLHLRNAPRNLEHQCRTLRLLVTAQLEVLASLERQLRLGLALCALQSQHNLLGGLSLLVEDRLGLTTVTGLLAIVTALTLGEEGGLGARLVFVSRDPSS